MKSAKRALMKRTFAVRLVIVGSALWALIVPAYVFLFAPYGSYMATDDYAHTLKIMLFPVAVLAAGYFAYSRLVVGDLGSPNEEQFSPAQTDATDKELLSPSSLAPELPLTLANNTSKTDSTDELLQRYGIARVEGQYVYGTYCFDQIKHAIAHARHVESLEQQ